MLGVFVFVFLLRLSSSDPPLRGQVPWYNMRSPCSGNAGRGCTPGLAGDCPEHHQPGADGDPGAVVERLFSSYDTTHRKPPSSHFQVSILIFDVIGFYYSKQLFPLHVWSLEFHVVPRILILYSENPHVSQRETWPSDIAFPLGIWPLVPSWTTVHFNLLLSCFTFATSNTFSF